MQVLNSKVSCDLEGQVYSYKILQKAKLATKVINSLTLDNDISFIKYKNDIMRKEKVTVQSAPFVKPHCVLIVAAATVFLITGRSPHPDARS